VELCAELGQHRGEVRLVLGPDHVADVALAARPLPVDVYAVEDAESGAGSALQLAAEHRQVALDKQVEGACHESLPVAGERRVGEELRPRPATQRENNLEVRVFLLELLELVEIAGERLVEGVGDAVNRLSGGEPALVIGPGVALAELVGLEAS